MSELLYYYLKGAKMVNLSLSVQVSRELGRRIVTGAILPGQLIEDEASLAKRFQVSRPVIKEAIKNLASKGLVSMRRGEKNKVHTRDKWQLFDNDVLAWLIASKPNVGFINQMMEIRLAFEPRAARWAAQNASQSAINKIDDACNKLECHYFSAEEYVRADAIFHQSILKASDNIFLNTIEGIIYSALLVSAQLVKLSQQTRDSHDYHRAIQQAIANGEKNKAEKLTEALLKVEISHLNQVLVA